MTDPLVAKVLFLTEELEKVKGRLARVERVATDGEADTLDGFHADTTATADYILALNSSGRMPSHQAMAITMYDQNLFRWWIYCLTNCFSHSCADNVETAIFNIVTPDNAGSNEGGCWTCFVVSRIGCGATQSSTAAAAKTHVAMVSHVNIDDGTPATSAVTEIAETASAATDSGTRDIGTVTMTANEIDDQTTNICYTVDSTGSSPTTSYVRCWVMVMWMGYSDAPVLTQAA